MEGLVWPTWAWTECRSLGQAGPAPTRPSPQRLQPHIPPWTPQSLWEDKSPPAPPWCSRRVWRVHLGNKSFLIPWQRGSLQSPHSNRAVFIEFLSTDYIHAWAFNSFITVKHSVMFLSEAWKMGIIRYLCNFGSVWIKIGQKPSMQDFRGSRGREAQEEGNLLSLVACFVTKCAIKSQTWNKKAHILLLITTHPEAFWTDGSTKHQNSSAYKLAKGPAVLLTEGVVRALHYLQIEILLERITVICRTWSQGFGKMY